jgi:hypothetical protein
MQLIRHDTRRNLRQFMDFRCSSEACSMINHNNIATRWLGLAEEIQQLAEKLPAGEDRRIAEKLVEHLKAGAGRENTLLLIIDATQAEGGKPPSQLSVRWSASMRDAPEQSVSQSISLG